MEIKKWVAMASVLLLFFSFPACSAGKKDLSWGNWWGLKNEKSVDQKGLESFFSNIRPSHGNAESHYLLACHYQERARHKEAIAEFKKVLSIDPNHLRAYNGLGVSFDHLRNYSLAIEYYKKALEIDPGLDYVQNNLGYSYLLAGKYGEAIKTFERAISLNPQEKRFHNNMALAYAENGQFDLAFNEFRKAGDEANAYCNLGQFYYKKGLYKEAKTNYARALELNPSSPTFKSGFLAASNLSIIFDSRTEKSKAAAILPSASSSLLKEEKAENNEAYKSKTVDFALKEDAPAGAKTDVENDGGKHVALPPPLKSQREIMEFQIRSFSIESKTEVVHNSKYLEYLEQASKNDANSVLNSSINSIDQSNHVALSSSSSQQGENPQVQSPSSVSKARIKNEAAPDTLQKHSRPYADPPFKIAIGYELQVASHHSIKNADFLTHSLKNAGFPATVKALKDKKGQEWYRSVLGPFKTYQEALAQKENILRSKKARKAIIQFAAIKIASPSEPGQEKDISPNGRNLIKTAGIEISNGNGNNGMAQIIGNCLNENGLKVVRLTNASSFNHLETKIYYQKGYHEAANYLAGYFPFCNNLKEIEKLDRSHVKVKILIGKDLVMKSKIQGPGKV